MKKIISCLLAIFLLASSSVTAFATDSSRTLLSSSTTDDILITDEEMSVINSDSNAAAKKEPEASAETRESLGQLPTSPSNALSITGNTPYHVETYNLTAGSAGYVKLTATQNYNCSVFTTGSKDTYIEVYSNAACTSLVTSNDDGGHGVNAKVYFYITSGTTYYIKVRGYSESTSGTYTFVLHRGMPTSRSEKDDMFTTYNSSTYKSYNNCYTYALGYYLNPVTGSKFRWNGQNPGEMSGDAITMEDLVDADTAKAAIEAALTADCNYFGGDWAEITSSAQPRAGYYKVALVLDPEDDYHWYRQLPNGQWGHKPGTTTAKKTDCSNYIIYYPNSCDRDGSDDGAPNYTEFLGWYEIKTPTSATATASLNIQDETLEITYPVKYDLTMDIIKELTCATSYESAMTILGDAHRYYGSGMIGNVYELLDGTEIIVYFSNGYIDQIRTVPENGEYEIIID